jgi:DMSO/TMAO reductase YedYZ heme-binding membrane subunit
MHCPRCDSASVQSLGKRNFFYPVALVVIMPTVLALLHQTASPIDYRCPDCGLRFARRTIIARFALVVMISLIAGIVMLLAFFSSLVRLSV